MKLQNNDAEFYLNFQSLSALKHGSKSQSQDGLREVASQFEGMFIKMMLKSMREASLGDPIFDNETTHLYQSMLDEQMSMNMAKTSGLGLADIIVEQLVGTVGQRSTGEKSSSVQTDVLSVTSDISNAGSE